MTTLKQLSEKIQSRFNRLTGLTLPIAQVKNTIKTISTDYANFTPEQQQQVMDILKDKNNSQIQNATGISGDEIETVRLEEQTLDNITGDNDMMESNDNNKMVKVESAAITFNDDFDKAIEVKSIANKTGIELSNKQALNLAEDMPNRFRDAYEFQQSVVGMLDTIFGSVAQKQSEKLVELTKRFTENRKLENDRLRFEVNIAMSDATDYTHQTTEAMLETMAASVGLTKEELRQRTLDRM